MVGRRLILASRGHALFPDFPDTPRGEKGLVLESHVIGHGLPRLGERSVI